MSRSTLTDPASEPTRRNPAEPDWFGDEEAMHALFEQCDAEGYIHWRMMDDESLRVFHGSSVIDGAVRTRSSELAEAAIRCDQTQTCILGSPYPTLLVAAPTPSIAGDCLSIAFPLDLGEQSIDLHAERVSQVEFYAANIQKKPKQEIEASESDHSDTQADDEPFVESIAISWIELGKLLRSKVVAQWRALQSRRLKLTVFAVAATVVTLLPWPHTIDCQVVCEPLVRRYVAAPFDARLLESHVVIGQQVAAGDLLASLDGSELRSQLASVQAKLAQAQQRESAALSISDHSKAEFERLEVEHLLREAEMLERRQSSLEVRSPIDGLVITGDLERAQGMPVATGDNLFEIAALDVLIAEVAVPEQNITYVGNGMPVSVVMDSSPGKALESKIQRIHLRNEIRDNTSIYIAEAKLLNENATLRPGMNATASVDAGYQALGWILFHRPFNAIRQWIGI